MIESLLQPTPLLALGWAHWVFIIPLCLLSVFLSLLILVQRGRGGGLTGALGGMGGQSAFGTKAGDVFTKITIVVAMFWILLSMGALKALHVNPLGSGTRQSADKKDTKKGTDTKGANPLDPAPSGITPENTSAPKGSTPAAPVDPPATPGASSPAPAAPAPAPPAPPSTPDSTSKDE